MAEINSLYFNDLEVDGDFRWLLKARFAEDDMFDLYNEEINLIPMDIDLKNMVDTPAVSLEVFQQESISPDDEQIQTYTPFTVEINVYTSGSKKVKNNNKICNEIIKLLQSCGQLPHYFCRGLSLQENRPVGSLLDSVYRKIMRFSGLCDNYQKLIKRR